MHIHSERHHFTFQNWECVKQGGWIDQQAADAVKAKSE
jgi:hypothetical protein